MPVEGPQYPVNLNLAGRPCLVVGGGAVAHGKVLGLLAVDAVVTVVAPAVVDGIVALEGVAVQRRAYEPGDVLGQRLVITATDDADVNRRVYLDGEAAGVWVNSADDPVNCAFTLPAVVRRGPVTVAVSTGGTSPALASWLRDRLAAELGPEYEELVRLLAERREALRSAGTPTEGLNWREALDSGMLELVREGRIAEARELLQACL
jgi:precorrin-2 dehydrogenase/sirohydrochlorin ferrochelatase